MIDINCDMGEINTLLDNGTYEDLMDHVTSINIACGGHAGDEKMIRAMVETAKEKKIKIGAHPSYPDRKNFGRYEMTISDEELSTSILEQITRVIDIAADYKYSISHMKPHGALYNKAANDESLATLIGEVIKSINPSLPVMCLAGSKMVSILIGGSIGFISGVVGIGGGIFLSPILLLVRADNAKNVATAASLFILINSISGLAGQFTKSSTIDEVYNY